MTTPPSARSTAGCCGTRATKLVEAADRPSARAAFEARAFPLVLLDLMLPPDGSVSAGLEQLGALLAARPGTKVIVVSGAGDTRHSLEAIRLGAYDFLTKPVDPDVLLVVVQRALARVALERQVEALQSSLAHAGGDTAMVGQSASVPRRRLARRAHRRQRSARPHHRRERHRQGAARPLHPPQEPPPRRALHPRQLRRAPREPPGERPLRPREGLVHRRHDETTAASSPRPMAARSSSTRLAT